MDHKNQLKLNKKYFVYYRDDECCLKIFENTIDGFRGFSLVTQYNERFMQLDNLPNTMEKIYINIYASEVLLSTLDEYKKYFENLPFLLKELNINVYIPNKKSYLDDGEIQKKFNLFLCKINKIPYGCKQNITYLNV